MTYGYARVSTKGQEKYGNGLDVQEKELKANGAEKIFFESFTGTKKNRPELDKLIPMLKEGDTLVVSKLDRIARSALDGLTIMEELLEKGVIVHILNMGKFDNTPTGRLLRTVLFGLAEFERDLIVERTQSGKAIKRENDPNYKEGRKAVQYDSEKYQELKSEVKAGRMSVSKAAELLNVSRAKWYRITKELEAV